MKLKNIVILLVCFFNVSFAFAGEVETKPYLPKDKSQVVWNNIDENGNRINHEKRYIEGSYVGMDDNSYLIKFYRHEKAATSQYFFANGIFALFGFQTQGSYLVKASEVANFSVNDFEKVIVTKVEPDLKSIDILKERDKWQEQLAKLHVLLAMISEGKAYSGRHFQFFAKGDDLLVFTDEAYGGCKSQVGTLAELIKPHHNWFMSLLFQKPFVDRILNNPQKTIDWLNNTWDEAKVDELAKQAGLSDEMLRNFKLIFANIKNQLQDIKANGFEVYSKNKIKQIIDEKKAKDSVPGFVAKNIKYEFKDVLPKVEEQMFICKEGYKVWLELTNFEFVINSKESNKIVTIYIGVVGDKNKATKIPIEMYDPETAFVFQDAIIRFWEKESQTDSDSHYQKLARALQIGYQAVAYHFGFTNYLNVARTDPQEEDFCEKLDLNKLYNASKHNTPINSPYVILPLYKNLHEKYKAQALSINIFVDKAKVEKRKKLGFVAYYPNPIYLGNIAKYLRPSSIGYDQYNDVRQFDIMNEIRCEEKYYTKNDRVHYDYCDEYTQILDQVYPDGMAHINSIYGLRQFKFDRVSAYGFRGDDRSLEEVYDYGGFWKRIQDINGSTYFSKDKDRLLADPKFWEMENGGGAMDKTLHTASQCYVSTSRNQFITKTYGGNVYLVFAEGGLNIPMNIANKNINTAGIMEIAIPGGIGWDNVIGVRESVKLYAGPERNSGYLTGPIFLKESLAQHEPDNFWDILQVFGGKSQCQGIDAEDAEFLVDHNCVNYLDSMISVDKEKIVKNRLSYFYRTLGLEDQEIENELKPELADAGVVDHIFAFFCRDSIKDAIGMEEYTNRR